MFILKSCRGDKHEESNSATSLAPAERDVCSTQILRTVFSPGGAAYPTYRPSGAKNENIGVYCYTHYAPPGLIYKESLVQEARFARDATKSLLRRTIEKAREDVKKR